MLKRMPAEPARVRAILGPTNTGKTHLAIERLVAHRNGIVGFPLRLLARENYDRMVAAKGADQVALVTGEEKIIPSGARWFACTVEAMPLDRNPAFVAVDEIQLAGDRDRGHIFTDRLLHARGTEETMFLGAETLAPLLRHLVPEAVVETRPRLSALTYSGHCPLSRIPPRSAVVGFSAPAVYEIAEAIRRRRGGCAIVMGRLSPRTRNAQVRMFQNREVDFLVATDAIGMGLNLDLDHVLFAGMEKFDGRNLRQLAPAELAQIAGRAGRGMRDGQFGVLAGQTPIPDSIVDQIESHRFEPLRTLSWRNSALDFVSTASLLKTLEAAPGSASLRRMPDAVDHQTLLWLLRDPEIQSLATSPGALRLLWQVCQIPDFRKLGPEPHVALCSQVFSHLGRAPGQLPERWINTSLESLDRTDGDIDTLMQRLSGVRVWSYLAARQDWVPHSDYWQAHTQRIEDRLSDVLHEALTARFVDRRATHLLRRLETPDPHFLTTVDPGGNVLVDGHLIGSVHGFRFSIDRDMIREPANILLRAARRVLADEIPRRLARLETSPDHAFRMDATGIVTWQTTPDPATDSNRHPVARLVASNLPHRPMVVPIQSEFLTATLRERLSARVEAWLKVEIDAALRPLHAVLVSAAGQPELRGLMHLLEHSLGILPSSQVPAELARKPGMLCRHGLVSGRFACFVPALLKPKPMQTRAALLRLIQIGPMVPVNCGSAVTIRDAPECPVAEALVQGWVRAGSCLVRLDVAERLARQMSRLTRDGPSALPPNLASQLGCPSALLSPILNGLGFAIERAEPDRLVRHRHGHPKSPLQHRAMPETEHSPFAVLAALKP
jgi:ATP-dependent RNA helicase SUPV3L1/SUV3